MDTLINDVEAKMAEVRQGGGPKAANRMRSQGKKLPRERYVRASIHAFLGRVNEKMEFIVISLLMHQDLVVGGPSYAVS